MRKEMIRIYFAAIPAIILSIPCVLIHSLVALIVFVGAFIYGLKILKH